MLMSNGTYCHSSCLENKNHFILLKSLDQNSTLGNYGFGGPCWSMILRKKNNILSRHYTVSVARKRLCDWFSVTFLHYIISAVRTSVTFFSFHYITLHYFMLSRKVSLYATSLLLQHSPYFCNNHLHTKPSASPPSFIAATFFFFSS
jgi:hypothetical protein